MSALVDELGGQVKVTCIQALTRLTHALLPQMVARHCKPVHRELGEVPALLAGKEPGRHVRATANQEKLTPAWVMNQQE